MLRTGVVCLHRYQLADGRACCAQALPVGDRRSYGAPGARCREKGWQDVPDSLSSENGVDDSNAAATAVRELLEGVRQGEPLQAGALTLIPLVAASEQVTRQTGYLPLEEALRHKLVVIAEQARAQVPELLATSTAEVPVVLVGGEQVVGGLQNRVLNTTILIAALSTLQIPVTCVEAGRWHEERASDDAPTGSGPAEDMLDPDAGHAARRAFTADEAAYATLRKLHAKSVTGSLSSGGGHRSDQGAVWGEVAHRMAFTGSYSPSGAMHTLYKTPERANKLKDTVEALRRPEGALGFVAVLRSHVLGAELFADEALADAYWQKLVRSYAVEALDAGERGGDDQGESIGFGETRLLEEALAAAVQVHPSPGLGADARLVGSRVSGAGLVHDGAVVHLSLFPEDGDSGGGPLQRTQRRYGGHRQASTDDE